MIKSTKKLKNGSELKGAPLTSEPCKPMVTPPRPSALAPAPVKVATAPATTALVPQKPVPATPNAAPLEKPKPAHVMLELLRPEAKQVCVAGSFNGWKPEHTPLVRAGNGRWVGDLAIKPGKHEYLFVVDGQWLPDPNAKESVQNPFGGRNSVLTVSE